jgi:hypothetical protein
VEDVAVAMVVAEVVGAEEEDVAAAMVVAVEVVATTVAAVGVDAKSATSPQLTVFDRSRRVDLGAICVSGDDRAVGDSCRCVHDSCRVRTARATAR